MKFPSLGFAVSTAGTVLALGSFGCNGEHRDDVYGSGAAVERARVDLRKHSRHGHACHPRQLQATLSGANEVPNPADANGSGVASFMQDVRRGTLCFELSLENVAHVTAAGVYAAPAGRNGPMRVDLNIPVTEPPPCLPAAPQILTASDGVPGNDFGRSLALMNGTALVGADNGAYVFVKTGAAWEEQQKLPGSEANFGSAVALSNDTAAVAADGAVRVFVRSDGSWSEQQTLSPSGALEQRFGAALALSGDRLLVGAPNDVLDGNNYGSVYVFERTGSVWSEQTRIRPGVNMDGLSCFGCAVALSGDTAVVGVPDAFPVDSGMVAVFQKNGAAWDRTTFLGSTGTPGARVGAAVALSADTALVGAPGFWVYDGPDLIGFGAAEAFVQSAGSWTEQRSDPIPGRYPFGITPTDMAGATQFGSALALSGDRALIGAPAIDAAYAYLRTAGLWGDEQKLLLPDGPGAFGGAVALEGVTAFVGAPGDVSTEGEVLVQDLAPPAVCDQPLQEFQGCVAVDRKLLNDLRQHPSRYYLDVLTTEFPGGAVRGQLALASGCDHRALPD